VGDKAKWDSGYITKCFAKKKWLDKLGLLVCSIFILQSSESDGGTIFWTNLHPLRSFSFPSFPVASLTSYHWICCLLEATKQR